MKLLITTQVLDTEDLVLGFFHEWVKALAGRMDSIEVICLKEGKHSLPSNVRVHSLGKERGARSRAAYALSYLSLTWRLRRDYDAAFVHMNQEYILIAGWLWKLLGKRVYMWRNHYAGSMLTDVAAAFCDTVFCTSKHSYTAKYRRTVLMPVGVDTQRFYQDPQVKRMRRSILFLGRMSPSKRPDMLLEALGMLIAKGASFTASFYGSPAKEDEAYYENLKHQAELLGLHDRVRFYPGIPNEAAANVYRTHEIFVNCSPSGMFDKTLFEASASGCLVLAASDDFARITTLESAFDSALFLAERLAALLSAAEGTLPKFRGVPAIVEEHSLQTLARMLADAMEPTA